MLWRVLCCEYLRRSAFKSDFFLRPGLLDELCGLSTSRELAQGL